MKTKLLKMTYIIFNYDGSIKRIGEIKKYLQKGLERRKQYLENRYLSLIKFV